MVKPSFRKFISQPMPRDPGAMASIEAELGIDAREAEDCVACDHPVNAIVCNHPVGM